MGIKPMWEDEANKFGGKWIVRLRKGRIIKSSLLISLTTPDLRPGVSLLGESGPGSARGTVHGRGGDLRSRGVHQVSGGHPQYLEQNCV